MYIQKERRFIKCSLSNHIIIIIIINIIIFNKLKTLRRAPSGGGFWLEPSRTRGRWRFFRHFCDTRSARRWWWFPNRRRSRGNRSRLSCHEERSSPRAWVWSGMIRRREWLERFEFFSRFRPRRKRTSRWFAVWRSSRGIGSSWRF